MRIDIKLDSDFSKCFQDMVAKYGEEMQYLNGFGKSQLNYTDFIDNFIDKNCADVSIDSNANVGQKDVVTLEREMSKPHLKLLSFNKIFYEMKKKYGVERAKQWLEEEWNGCYYLHDAYSATLKSYCILPQECCTFILNGKHINCSLQDIYDKLSEAECVDHENGVRYKKPNNLSVLDYDKEINEYRYTRVLMVSTKETDEDFIFTKLHNGANIITTSSHKFICESGDIKASELVESESVCYSTYDKHLFTNSLYEYNGLELTRDLGYIVGMYLAEGYNTRGQLSICQSFEKSRETYDKIISLLTSIGIPYTEYRNRGIIRLKNGNNNWERKLNKLMYGKLCSEKRLCEDYIHFNDDFLMGVLSGIIDGDGTIAQNDTVMIRMTSRTLINQIRAIGLHFGVFFGSRLPYIQDEDEKRKIISKIPIYSANVNMNRNKEFFLSLDSIKVKRGFNNFSYDEKMANKNYECIFGKVKVRDNKKTYKPSAKVFDLSTESHSFICNDILVHNCFAYDLEPIVKKGLYFIKNNNAQPPKHLVTFTDFVGETVSWCSNRTSGAVGLPNFLIYSFYFWKKDCESGHYMLSKDYYRDQEFQRIIYKLNQPYLRVDQSAFTNFSIFDHEYLVALFGGKEFPDGTFIVDYIDDIIEYEKDFMRVCSKIRSENMMTFPVLSFCLLRKNGKFIDEDFAKWCCKHNMQWADSNFFVSEDVTSLSNCCRLVSNVKNLGYFNSIGGTALEVGSVKVNTINLARIAYETNDKDKFLSAIEDRVMLCVQVLDRVRHIIERNIEKGLLPNYTYDLIHLKNQYNTIGIVACWEAVKYLGGVYKDEFGNWNYTEYGLNFAKEILNKIHEAKNKFISDEKIDYQINIEQVPAERCASILQEKDKLLYSNGVYDLPLYGNQWIPLGEKTTLFDKLSSSKELDKACSGGSIAHINIDAPFTNFDMAWELLNKIADTGVPYFAFCTRISACEHNHGFYGETCPICGGKKVTTYQRVVGFLTPERNYSNARKEEFKMRDWFKLASGEDTL